MYLHSLYWQWLQNAPFLVKTKLKYIFEYYVRSMKSYSTDFNFTLFDYF